MTHWYNIFRYKLCIAIRFILQERKCSYNLSVMKIFNSNMHMTYYFENVICASESRCLIESQSDDKHFQYAELSFTFNYTVLLLRVTQYVFLYPIANILQSSRKKHTRNLANKTIEPKEVSLAFIAPTTIKAFNSANKNYPSHWRKK